MSELLREIDDAVRADNMKRLWEEHKTAIIAGVSALILGTAVFSGWNTWQTKQNEAGTTRVMEALEAPKPIDALNAAADQNSGNSKVIALLNVASLELKAGQKDKALDAYAKAQAVTGGDATLKDLATLQKVSLTLDVKPDTKTDDLLKELSAVAENKKSPWQAEAIFMSSFIKGEKNNDFAGASTELKALASRDDVSNSLKQRASALQSVYDMKTAEKK